MFALEGIGVIIEHSPADYRRGVCSNLFIANKALAEAFADYATNHVPQVHALSMEDTNTFLATLIDGLG